MLADDTAEVDDTAGELATMATLTSLLRRALRVIAETELAERRGGADKAARYRRRPRREAPPTLFDEDPF